MKTKTDLEDVKNVIERNLDKLFDRGLKLEVLEKKTDTMKI